MAAPRKSTRLLLLKIPNVTCLYRHTVNARYYGIKKLGRKRKEHSLGTTDRKLAERELKQWMAELDKVDTAAAKTSLAVLLERFLASTRGKAAKTWATNQAMVNVFKRTWRHGLNVPVSEVKRSFPRKGGQKAENLRKKIRHVHHHETETNDTRS